MGELLRRRGGRVCSTGRAPLRGRVDQPDAHPRVPTLAGACRRGAHRALVRPHELDLWLGAKPGRSCAWGRAPRDRPLGRGRRVEHSMARAKTSAPAVEAPLANCDESIARVRVRPLRGLASGWTELW